VVGWLVGLLYFPYFVFHFAFGSKSIKQQNPNASIKQKQYSNGLTVSHYIAVTLAFLRQKKKKKQKPRFQSICTTGSASIH